VSDPAKVKRARERFEPMQEQPEKINGARAQEAWEGGPPDDWDDDLLGEQHASKPTESPPTIWAPELAQPLAPISWISKGLTMAPGRANVLAGEGGTRKGWFAMDLQVCAAAGITMLGRFAMRELLRSVYFDYEQTERPSRERFQLLAAGHEIDLASLGNRLGYRWKPIPTWAPKTEADRARAIDILCWHTEGLGLAIVDSTRTCAHGVDENSVFASGPFDIATEVSERTGVAFAFLDHAGKPRDDATSGRTRKHAQRGHSSKLDAVQTLLVFSAAKGEPTLVTCERSQIAAESDWPADFRFTIARANGGLQLQEVVSSPKAKTAFAELKDRIVDLVRHESALDSKNAICSRVVGANKTDKLQAIAELLKAGKLVQPGGEGSPFHAHSF
jgi:AAA domain-containing protein